MGPVCVLVFVLIRNVGRPNNILSFLVVFILHVFLLIALSKWNMIQCFYSACFILVLIQWQCLTLFVLCKAMLWCPFWIKWVYKVFLLVKVPILINCMIDRRRWHTVKLSLQEEWVSNNVILRSRKPRWLILFSLTYFHHGVQLGFVPELQQ